MQRPIKVLIIDDEERFLATTATILAHKGFQPLVAASGDEGLGKLVESPDVIVLDIRMKGMDGEATLQIIKGMHPDIPVIMLTGHGEQASAERAVALGAFDYLTKPTDIDLLACKINEAFRYAGAAKKDREKVAGDLMTPIEKCLTFPPEMPLGEAVAALSALFIPDATTATALASGENCILVAKAEAILGIVSMWEIVDIVRPPYLTDSELRSQAVGATWRFSPLFWNGMFDQRLSEIAEIPLGGAMALPPPPISRSASLIEVCDLMKETSSRRLLVMEGAKVVGIVCEQDLFVEMVHLHRRRKAGGQ
jgi:CheY-like chemotaxis protein